MLLQVPDEPAEALALIERAETLFDPRWVCQFCPTGYHVAAATVCARAGRPERAREFLARAEHGATRWPGGPWPAALAEARAELLLAEGDQRAAADALRRAAEGYAAAGQLLNERLAREALERLGRAEISASGRFREGPPATLPACRHASHCVVPATPPIRIWAAAPMFRGRLRTRVFTNTTRTEEVSK